jgi:hypothetical protein
VLLSGEWIRRNRIGKSSPGAVSEWLDGGLAAAGGRLAAVLGDFPAVVDEIAEHA